MQNIGRFTNIPIANEVAKSIQNAKDSRRAMAAIKEFQGQYISPEVKTQKLIKSIGNTTKRSAVLNIIKGD